MIGKYTLVQHSGFGYGHNPQFEAAVEQRMLANSEIAKVAAAGGLILDGYVEADERAYAENYPAENKGFVPEVKGRFHRTIKIDDLKLYIPTGGLNEKG